MSLGCLAGLRVRPTRAASREPAEDRVPRRVTRRHARALAQEKALTRPNAIAISPNGPDAVTNPIVNTIAFSPDGSIVRQPATTRRSFSGASQITSHAAGR